MMQSPPHKVGTRYALTMTVVYVHALAVQFGGQILGPAFHPAQDMSQEGGSDGNLHLGDSWLTDKNALHLEKATRPRVAESVFK
jgi:hypothetical protein